MGPPDSLVNLLPTLVGGGGARVVGGGAGKCDGTDPGERTEACELALLQQAMKQENVGIEELVQLSAAVSDPPTAALALTASNTVLLLFTEPVLSIATAEPLAADDLTMLLDGVIVTAASRASPSRRSTAARTKSTSG